MPKEISLSVFFPAYNEEENLRRTIESAFKYLENEPRVGAYEVIIVNDGSTDSSEGVVKELKSKYKNLILINHGKNLGYGAALISGFRNSRYDYIFFSDADMQFDLTEISLLLPHINQYDVVIGYRENRQDAFMRKVNAKGWNILNFLLFGLRIRDIDGAFKLIKRSLVENMTLKSKGAMISAELLMRLQEKNVEIKEVPVSHYPRKRGKSSGAHLGVITQAFAEMIKLYFSDLGPVHQKQVFKFIMVGVVNTFVDIVIYFLLTRTFNIFADHIIIAKAISFFVGTINSFILNRFWTFNKKDGISSLEIIKFYTVVLSSLLINISVMYLFVFLLNQTDVVAVFIATIATFVWNFILSKKWVFKS